MKILTCLVAMVWIFTMTETAEGLEKRKLAKKITLPAEAAGWAWDGKEMTYDPQSVFKYMNGAAELYLAYGFQNLRVRRFEKPSQPSITLELYAMASSENAYGVFSFERRDEAVGIGQGSEFGGGLLRFWKGKYFVSIYADGEGGEVESAILMIGRTTADLIQEMGPEPELIDLIPGKDFGLVDRSVRYLKNHVLLNQRIFIAHENILNLSRRSEAVLAQYMREKEKVHLLLVRYPNVKEAQDAYQSFMGVYLPDAGGKDRLKTEDQKWTMAREKDEVIIVVFGAPAAADAEALLKVTEEKLLGKQVRNMKIRMNVEGTAITATLLDNETSRGFVALLPLTLTLKDYAATEKISDLPKKLSTQGSPPGCDPSVGDITYYAPWGNLALFYKDFGYSNGLVKLGSIDSGVEALNRPGPLRVTIELTKE